MEFNTNVNVDIPEVFKKMLIAIEDKRFFYHSGIDIKAIFRACWINIRFLSIRQGGSTITQQLARNLLKDNSRTLSRKICEAKLAIRLERRYSKHDILSFYFNNVYWGYNIYGIEAASYHYFKKAPDKLILVEQIALLTLLRGPNRYIANENLYMERFQILIKSLIKAKIITRSEGETLSKKNKKIFFLLKKTK